MNTEALRTYMTRVFDGWGWENESVRDYVRFKSPKWAGWYSGIVLPMPKDGVLALSESRIKHAKTHRVFFVDPDNGVVMWCGRDVLQKLVRDGRTSIDLSKGIPKFMEKRKIQ